MRPKYYKTWASGAIGDLVEIWKERKDSMDEISSSVMRDRITELWIQAEALRLTNWRAREGSKSGNPGPEGSVGKLMSAEMNQKIYELCMEIIGPEALTFEAGYERNRAEGSSFARGSSLKYSFLRSRANTIEGGTSEVMRNILGERVLGLPGDVRVDKEVNWVDVPRN